MNDYLPLWIGILLVLALYLLSRMHRLERFDNAKKEGDGAPTETREEYDAIYDDFYAGIYDTLFATPELVSFQKASIREYGLANWAKDDVKVLDACCGTAPMADWMCKENIDFVGMDKSEAMLKVARKKCKSARFYQGDITRAETFTPKSFSHCLMLYFSIYQFQNPKMVLDNIYSWLKPSGVLVLHLVDPNKFDPILAAASPFPAFSLQKYSTERVIDSDLFFDSFKYRSRFVKSPEDDEARFEEVFEFHDPPKYVENNHVLHMPSVDAMFDIVRSSGFTRQEMVDMTPIGYEYQYLLYLTK